MAFTATHKDSATTNATTKSKMGTNVNGNEKVTDLREYTLKRKCYVWFTNLTTTTTTT